MGKIKDAVKTVRLETAPSASTVSSTSWKIPVEVKVFDPPVNGRAVLVKYIQPAFVHAGDPSKNRPAETRFAFFASKAQADRAILEKDGKEVLVFDPDYVNTVRESDVKVLLASGFLK